jgi:hypothetical protein
MILEPALDNFDDENEDYLRTTQHPSRFIFYVKLNRNATAMQCNQYLQKSDRGLLHIKDYYYKDSGYYFHNEDVAFDFMAQFGKTISVGNNI